MDITHSMYDNKLTANVSTFVSQHTMPRSWNTLSTGFDSQSQNL